MANAANLAAPVGEIGKLPIFRQMGVMVGLAASVALGVAVVLWSQEPNFTMLYGSLSGKDASEVSSALQSAGIPYKIEQGTGAILVASGKVHEARMKLAADGLPNGSTIGFELLDKDTGFGGSKFNEDIRFRRALEGEIARSISSMRDIQSARVHLAVPRQSAFARNRKHPTASIILDLHSGRTLEPGQVEAIVHLAAASVPDLEPRRVTVVDDRGRVLSNKIGNDGMMMAGQQFEHKQKLETAYMKRIEDILAPIVGAEGVRAQVTVVLDMTSSEQTQESFNPDQPALRSERVLKDSNKGGIGAALGIPGALSNRPPAAGTTAEQAANEGGNIAASGPSSSSEDLTRNYELDKVISHTRRSSGAIRSLSVAVVIDDAWDGDTNTARTAEEMERLSNLVREAVGFDVRRGDSLNVINATFMKPEIVEALPEEPIYMQPWVWDLGKQALGAVFVLLLLFGVLRPTMKGLVTRKEEERAALGAALQLAESQDGVPQLAGAAAGQLGAPSQYQDQLQYARQAANQDPQRVAQVMKSWVGTNG